MVSEQGLKIVKILAGVSAMLASVLVIIRPLRSRHRKKAAAAATAPRNTSRKSLQTSPKKKAYKAEIKKWYRGAIDKIVTARLQKESNTKSGEPVSLSHYIIQGRLRHWVLHDHNHNYELRQRVANESHPKPYYAAAIAPSGFNIKKYQQSLTVDHSPEAGQSYPSNKWIRNALRSQRGLKSMHFCRITATTSFSGLQIRSSIRKSRIGIGFAVMLWAGTITLNNQHLVTTL
ncbi:unnamed protein product [Penicillium discolor]